MHKLIEIYLTNKIQMIGITKCRSTECKTGVPHFSILDPLPVLIYINDISDILPWEVFYLMQIKQCSENIWKNCHVNE